MRENREEKQTNELGVREKNNAVNIDLFAESRPCATANATRLIYH